MRLDPDAVPPYLRQSLALAEQWGIPDDGFREEAVDAATDEELRRLVAAVDSLPEDLYDWLAGPAAYVVPSSREYVVFTALTEAADSARVTLRRRNE